MSNNKSIKFILVLIIIILLLAGYIVVDKFVFVEKEEPVTTQISGKDIDLNAFYEINNTMNLFNDAFNDPTSNYYGYLYAEKELYADEFDPSAALYVSIYKEITNTNSGTISGSIIKNNFSQIFGNYLKYKPKTIDVGTNYNLNYDKKSDTYSYNVKELINNKHAGYITKDVSTNIEKEDIVVKKKVLFVEYVSEQPTETTKEPESNTTETNTGEDAPEADENIPEEVEQRVAEEPTGKANIYTSKDKKKLVATVNLKNGVLNVDEIVGKYGSRLSTFKYTFKARTTSEYIFYSIEKIK